jgi:hypothetical protein
MAPNSYFNDYV